MTTRGGAIHTNPPRGSLSTSTQNTNKEPEQGESTFPIWVISVLIVIVIIGICAVVSILVHRQRKNSNHQPANNAITDTVIGPSNWANDYMINDKNVMSNPTYNQDVNEKEEEYHSYTEIDVKKPNNADMMYNSAYETTPTNSSMVYNSAYEREDISSDMIYNSTYESSS